MARVRVILGFAAGVIMILSSVVHSVVGWGQLHAELEATHAPAGLTLGLLAIWQFAGGAMLALGCIVLACFARRGGSRSDPLAVRIIALLYVAFGLWALAISHFDPFFLVFIVPGALLAIAAGLRGPGPNQT